MVAAWRGVSTYLARGVRIAGLPEAFRFHDLRHHLASLLIGSGLVVKVVQHRLRHGSGKTTLDTYGHLWPDSDESARAAVGAVLAAFLWPPNSDGRRRVDAFLAAFTAKFNRFREPQRHPKWRDVNLSAEIPGWVKIQQSGKSPLGLTPVVGSR